MGDDGYMDAAAVPVPDAGDDTLREQLIEAAVVVWQHRSDEQITASPTEHCAAMADALLPLIREHTAKAELRADARARVEEIKQRSRAEKAEAEVERLTDWKESATTVMSGLQDLGKELGLPLGESITGTLAAETAHRLRTRAEKADAQRDTLRTLLAHPSTRDLLEHHRHLDSGGCHCLAYTDHGPADMTRTEWIAHVIDDAKTRGMV